MTNYAYLFEAKSIQSYILATNRLKEIVGASELVERLTGSFDSQDALLNHALNAIGGNGKIQFSRKGGATFYAFSECFEVIDKLASLWPLLVRQYAPDLEFAQAKGEGKHPHEAFENAQQQLLANRNCQATRLPQAGPFAIRNRRTGEPATKLSKNAKSDKPEPVDAATWRKLKFAEAGKLAKRFAENATPGEWPTLLTPEKGQDGRNFPFKEERQTIALIHADGNGLGQVLIHLQEHAKNKPDDYLKLFKDFSESVTRATQQAARNATIKVLQEARKDEGIVLYPARPIVLGGDDLTIIVRADLAMKFTQVYLKEFARLSKDEMSILKKEYPSLPQHLLPGQLTACAGVAYAKASVPFYLLHGLAEDLCKQAKSMAKPKAKENKREGLSALSFHRITTAMVDDYQDILKRELTIPGDPSLCQTLQAYALEPDVGLPCLDHLLELQKLLGGEGMARGPTRQVLGLIEQDLGQAKQRYKRWQEVMSKKMPKELEQFDQLVASLLKGDEKVWKELPYGEIDLETQTRHSPLGDVMALLAVGSE